MPQPAGERDGDRGSNSYGQIVKSTALIGGSSVVNIAVRIVRAKLVALMLGPSGVGLLGLYSSVLDLTYSVSEMGVNRSGVRQIAEAVGSGDDRRIARTAAVLSRSSLALGLLGAIILIALRRPLSVWTFGSEEFAPAVALLSLAVLFMSVSDGQAALIQGMRRISDLAQREVLAAVVGTLVTIVLLYVFGERAVVPSLVIAAAITFLISWVFRRRIDIQRTRLTLLDIRRETGDLLKLGFAFMASAVLSTGAAYAIRIIVRNEIGIDAAGLYQSAWALGGLYVGFILQAMGSDFYPRLTGIAHDNRACNRMVNEQAEVSMLLAGPGILGTITFAQVVISVFYASSFSGAVAPLRWVCVGMALRVIAWPMGYIILAKNARSIFFWTEVAATVVHVGLAYLLVGRFGLTGATMAFAALYVWHGVLIYAIVHRFTGFTWSNVNRRNILLFLPTLAATATGFAVLPSWAAVGFGVVTTVASGVYALRAMSTLVALHRLPEALRRMLTSLRLVKPQAMAPAGEVPTAR